MKKLFTGVALLGIFAFATAQTITFDKNVIDYGAVAKGSNGEKVFTFKNTGDKPLIINNVQSSCGCTIPKWTNEPVAPGKTGEIKVHYDTQRVGVIQKQIQVSSNDPVNGTTMLHISGEVKADATKAPAVEQAQVSKKVESQAVKQSSKKVMKAN